MECHHAAERLSLFVDGELGPLGEEEVHFHLGGCESCRCHLKELERNRSLLAHLPRLPLPEELLERVIREAETPVPRFPKDAGLYPPQRRWKARRVLAMAAGLVLLCLAALTLLGYWTDDPGLEVASRPVVNRHALDTGAPLLGEPPFWTTASYAPGAER